MKLHIGEIMNDQGEVLTKSNPMGNEAINFFSKQFNEEEYDEDYSMLDVILRIITNIKNEEMVQLLEEKELKKVVFT